jgi:hypothetical protein
MSHITYYDQASLNKARSDKFSLRFNIPLDLIERNKRFQRNNNTFDITAFQFSVFGTVVPKIQVPAIDAKYSGSNIYVSSHAKPSYEPVTVKFTVDNMFNNYWVIFSWLDLLRDQDTDVYKGELRPNDKGLGHYSTDFEIVGKDEFNKDIIKWVYKSAFPTDLGEITYNYRSPDEIESEMTFVFRSLETILL